MLCPFPFFGGTNSPLASLSAFGTTIYLHTMKLIAILAALALSIGYAVAAPIESVGTITGSVRNAVTQELVVGATVKLEGTKLGAYTNTKGEFTIKNIPPKSYTVVVSAVGFKGKSLFNTVVTSGNIVSLSIDIDPDLTKAGSIDVEVRSFGKRSETPLSVQSLTTEEIRSNPGGNFDISRVLQALPGVGGATGGASFRNDITIRGGGPSENVYYLDGIEIPQINHFATQGSAGGPAGILNVSFIEDVNLSSSSFGSGYDNALSSIIAIKQKDGNSEKLQGNLRVSATEVAATVDGPVSENTTVIASARKSYLDFLFAAIDLPIRPNYWDFQFKTTTKIDNKTTLNVIGVGAIDVFRFGIPRETSLEKEYVLRAAPSVDQWNYTIGASLRKALDNGQVFVSLSRNMFDNKLQRTKEARAGNPAEKVFDVSSREIENKFRLEYTQVADGVSYKTGVQAQYVKYTNNTFNRLNDFVTLNFNSNIDFFKYGVYADATTSFLNDRLRATAGIRADGNTFMENGNDIGRTISPRAALSFIVDSSWSINATVGRYYKIPQYPILGYRDANSNLVNTGASYIGTTHYVAGVEYMPEPSIRVTMEGFYKLYDGYPISTLDGISLANQGTNFGIIGNEPIVSSGKGRAYGAELFFQKKLTENFFATISYTLLYSEFTGLNSDKYIPSAWDFRHLVSGIVGYKFGEGWEFGGKIRYAGGSPYTAYDTTASRRLFILNGFGQLDFARLNEERLRAFRQVDVRIDKKWSFTSWSLDLFIDVQNVFAFSLDAPAQYSFTRTADNADWASTDGQPVRPDGSNATAVFIDNSSTLVTPTIGIIIEF
jgi:hypothetical protein